MLHTQDIVVVFNLFHRFLRHDVTICKNYKNYKNYITKKVKKKKKRRSDFNLGLIVSRATVSGVHLHTLLIWVSILRVEAGGAKNGHMRNEWRKKLHPPSARAARSQWSQNHDAALCL